MSVDYIDPDTRPIVAREFDIQAYGTVVIDYMGKRERVTSDTEQDLTNALIKAMSTMERKVYFLQGHGEKEPNRTERDGYSAVSGSLRRDNYMVERLVLAQMKEVPDDATVVLIAGPTTDLLDTEAEAIRRYLARAGKLMVMVDPLLGPQAAPLPNLEGIVKEWGVTLGNNVVVDVSGATNDPSIAVAATYPMHAITERFATLTIYPLARSINPVEGGANGRTAQTIVETSRQSWAEANLASLSGEAGVSMDEASGDKVGPVPLGVAVSSASEPPAANPSTPATGETLKPETRVVVLRRLGLPQQRLRRRPGQHELLRQRHQLAGAAGEPDRHPPDRSAGPPRHDDRRVSRQAVFWTSIFVMPALVFARGHLSPGGGGGSARTQVGHPAARRARRTRRLHLFRRLETGPSGGRPPTPKAFTELVGGQHRRNRDPQRRRRDVARAAGRRQTGSSSHPTRRMPTTVSSARSRAISRRSRSSASSTRTRPTWRSTDSIRRAIDVSFRLKDQKDFQRLLVGEKTPTGGDFFAKRPNENRVFLISSFLDSIFNKTTFDLRDKAVLKFDRDQATGIEIVSGASTTQFTGSGSEWRIAKPIERPGGLCSRRRADDAAVLDLHAEDRGARDSRPEAVRPRPAGADGHGDSWKLEGHA